MRLIQMLIGIGAGVWISINFGKKEFNLAERVLGNSFILMIIVGAVNIVPNPIFISTCIVSILFRIQRKKLHLLEMGFGK